LDYVADSTGSWYIKISRSSGEGEYQLSIDIKDQDDAGSGQDAGDSYQEAIPISSGTWEGLLKAGDNNDYYSLNLAEGEAISLQLTIPGNASYGIILLNPHNYSRGSSTTQGNVKTLDYVADSTGTWYIRVSRSSGEGEYQLSVNDFTDGSEGEENHPPVISSLTSSQNSVEVNQTANLSCTASDRDGDPLTYNWTVNGQLVGGNTSSLNWVAPGIPGTYHITCTVSDSKGSQDSDSVSIIVIEPGGSSDQIPTQVLYQIKITTGTKMGAGTDANVYLTLVGQNGENSGEILLDNPGINDFERGDTNIFCINTIPIENLHHIIIRHDNTGNLPGWYIEEVHIACSELNKDWFFYPRQWLATDEPPGYRTQGTFYPQQEEFQETSTEYSLSLTESGRILTSNLPIFTSAQQRGNAEVDADGDGINQEWEDKAMEYINPYIELDEEEDWLTRNNADHVANYVRIHPSDSTGNSNFSYHSENLSQYIIFRYVVTWSFDYGRYGIMEHKDDHECIFLAWKVIDNKTLRLEWVFTSSHRSPNAHHGVWNAWHKTCSKGDVALTNELTSYSEIMCSNLQFYNNRLLIYASEDKHAMYPSCDLCEDVSLWIGLAGEDCGGGGTFQFDCYNVGEPPNFTDPHIHDLTFSEVKLGNNLSEDDMFYALSRKMSSRYRIQLKTGNENLSGTDAKISIKLFGSEGTSPWYNIYSTSPPHNITIEHLGTFETGDTDNIYVNSSDLGEVNKIQIKHDNTGPGPGWLLSEILVENLETHNIWHSCPNTWLDKFLLQDDTNKTFNLSLTQ
jgi:hypothetical protein